MISKSKVIRFLSLSLAVFGFFLIAGSLNETNAQCNGDPFCLPSWKKPKTTTTTTTNGTTTTKEGKKTPEKKLQPAIVAVAAPPIEQRIAYYKQMREEAALNGAPIPKVTTVLTIDEMVITGIFKTPRGYSAMVEATPIKLSFTIYPGEKFFDGRLVAVEENRVVFSKVTKMSNNKFITSVDNKTLRQYTIEQEVQGTTPVQTPAPTNPNQTEVVENNTNQQPENKSNQQVAPTRIISPVDEMNNQPEEKPKDSVKEKNNKKSKKPVKVAKKS